ncbi:CBY1-interacting BAR domain-containing protein 2 [Salmo salar]|uniref:CBY1-interacting BAR domain-containing protein 2 n=1 Tax=Salmo salar TaxID=8030 RepID=A0A1S3KV16_SALSA|nr:CBY1-interacting BAR domain-containing protein 2 [Salmo salar]|eukprot:XP_013982551.1 PREDICTED: protein FAM92B [Salmo salar]
MNTIFSRDRQIKSMELTVSHAEKYLGQFCSLLASYTRKTAKLRDQADMLVRQLNDFSNTEDPELRTCLKNLAEDLAMVQDYRQAEVERLEIKVVTPLKAYGDIVENKRADLKRFNADRDRALKELQKLEKLQQKNPSDRQRISQADVNAQKATNDAHRSTRQLEETISDFQRQKLEDIKRIFTDFITVEMVFHAKALEVYTHTFQNLDSMDIDKDLELFTGRIRVSDGPLDNQTLLPSSMAHQPSPTLGSSLKHTAESAKKSRSSILQRQRVVEEEEEEDEEEYESEIEAQWSRQSYASQYAQILRQKN